MLFRELSVSEVDRIEEIDATHFIQNVWRQENSEWKLVEINWTDTELPNGLSWHKERFVTVLEKQGKAYGCFEQEKLIGYTVVTTEKIGTMSQYVLLDQLFVSKNYRKRGIGKRLFMQCVEHAKKVGASKLFLAAGSAEDTIAFYQKIGCDYATEMNQRLFEDDPRDIQMEFTFSEKNT